MDRRKWLGRLIPVRVIVFTVFVVAQLYMEGRSLDLLILLGVVYALSACWYGLLKLNKSYVAQAYAQIGVDLLLITWTVNRTGGVDSYFSNIYFLEIVMSGVLLERRGAFLTATASSIIHFADLDLAYFNVIPSTGNTFRDLSSLQYIISQNIFCFCAVAYLSNSLAESLRGVGAQLEKSTGQVAFLQAFSDRIVDSMGSGLVTTDMEGRVYLFNRAAEEITGRPSDDASHLKVWEMFPGMPPKVETSRFELSTASHEGKEIYLRFSVSPIMIDENNTAGYVWCFDDLTSLRSLERQMQQKEQMAAIGAMSAGIAHEIRNPLASISGSFNLLRSDIELNSDQRRLVDIISRETERLNRTITDFLAYARPSAPQREAVDLATLISETVSLLRNSPEVKTGHHIRTRLDSVRIPVDESMMRQVFYNLASNAFRAMPDGGTLTVGLEGRNGGARIEFEDTGVGMNDEELKRMFVPFNSTFRNGTGLGLPIVYQIVNSHNGTIAVKSRKGQGTSFVIEL